MRRRSLLVTALIAACATASEPSDGLQLAGAADPSVAIVADAATDSAYAHDPITIEAASVVGDTLVAMLSHGGGCRPHDYRLVVLTTWMESFPVQVPARISHDAHDDRCKALLRREFRVSLGPLADAYRAAYRAEHGVVAIVLRGSPATLLYRF